MTYGNYHRDLKNYPNNLIPLKVLDQFVQKKLYHSHRTAKKQVTFSKIENIPIGKCIHCHQNKPVKLGECLECYQQKEPCLIPSEQMNNNEKAKLLENVSIVIRKNLLN